MKHSHSFLIYYLFVQTVFVCCLELHVLALWKLSKIIPVRICVVNKNFTKCDFYRAEANKENRVPFLVRCNPAHFENFGRPFRNIGCTTLSHDGSQGYYHQYGQILAQVFQGCCVCLVLCSALEEGMHKTYLLRVSPSSSAYYTPNYLVLCLDIGPNLV